MAILGVWWNIKLCVHISVISSHCEFPKYDEMAFVPNELNSCTIWKHKMDRANSGHCCAITNKLFFTVMIQKSNRSTQPILAIRAPKWDKWSIAGTTDQHEITFMTSASTAALEHSEWLSHGAHFSPHKVHFHISFWVLQCWLQQMNKRKKPPPCSTTYLITAWIWHGYVCKSAYEARHEGKVGRCFSLSGGFWPWKSKVLYVTCPMLVAEDVHFFVRCVFKHWAPSTLVYPSPCYVLISILLFLGVGVGVSHALQL